MTPKQWLSLCKYDIAATSALSPRDADLTRVFEQSLVLSLGLAQES